MCEPAYANLRFAVRRCFIFRLLFVYPYATNVVLHRLTHCGIPRVGLLSFSLRAIHE